MCIWPGRSRLLAAAVGFSTLAFLSLAPASRGEPIPAKGAPASPLDFELEGEPSRFLGRTVAGDAVAIGGVWSISYSPDGKRLATGQQGDQDRPSSLWVWDVANRLPQFHIEEDQWFRAVAFAPDGKAIVTSGSGTIAQVRDALNGRVLQTLQGHESGINSVAYGSTAGPSRQRAMTIRSTLGDPNTGQRQAHTGHSGPVCIRWPRSRQQDARLRPGRPYGPDLGCGFRLLKLEAHSNVIESVAFSPTGTLVATASWDKTVKLWDPRTGREVRTVGGHPEAVLGVSFSPDGKTVAASTAHWGDGDYTPRPAEIWLWDVATGKEIARLMGHANRVFSVAFAPDGKTLKLRAATTERSSSGTWPRGRRCVAAAGSSGGSRAASHPCGRLCTRMVRPSPRQARTVRSGSATPRVPLAHDPHGA